MVKLLQWSTRIAGVLALIFGILIGRVSYGWLPRAHVALGLVVVVALALIAVAGFFARVQPALPLVALVWAGGTVYVGIAQTSLMIGDAHWIVEVAHAVLGIGAIGLAEAIGARV
jgi:uncharacterized protein YqgC (DUF456 family)